MKKSPIPGSRQMYNYNQAIEHKLFMRASKKADDYNEIMVGDIPDDYPDKDKLAEMFTYEYMVEQRAALSDSQYNRYIELLYELNYIDEVEAAERMRTNDAVEHASYRGTVLGGLAVEFVDQK